MVELNGKTIGITLQTGEDINVDIVPVLKDKQGNLASAGAFNLYRVNEGDKLDTYLGQLSFNPKNIADWNYDSEQLAYSEVVQIVLSLQKDF